VNNELEEDMEGSGQGRVELLPLRLSVGIKAGHENLNYSRCPY
jgi:hypothetical protein